MYVVVVGGGRIGSAIARWVIDADHEVTVIDMDATKCVALEEELGSIAVVGDGTEEGTLARAGVSRADIFVATTPNDDENLVACQMAKHRFGASRTVSLVDVSGHDRLFKMLGVDITIDTTQILLGRVQEELSEILSEGV